MRYRNGLYRAPVWELLQRLAESPRWGRAAHNERVVLALLVVARVSSGSRLMG